MQGSQRLVLGGSQHIRRTVCRNSVKRQRWCVLQVHASSTVLPISARNANQCRFPEGPSLPAANQSGLIHSEREREAAGASQDSNISRSNGGTAGFVESNDSGEKSETVRSVSRVSPDKSNPERLPVTGSRLSTYIGTISNLNWLYLRKRLWLTHQQSPSPVDNMVLFGHD